MTSIQSSATSSIAPMSWLREKRIVDLQKEVSQLFICGTHESTSPGLKHWNEPLPGEPVHRPKRAEVGGDITLNAVNGMLFQPATSVSAQRTIGNNK